MLLAAALLVATELVSLSVLLRGIGDNQARRTSEAIDRALSLMPRIAEWARSRMGRPGEFIAETWIEPFDRAEIEDINRVNLSPADRRRLTGGELVVMSQLTEGRLSVLGLVRGESGEVLVRLSETAVDTGIATERTVILQHSLILLAALAGLALAVLGRENNRDDDPRPALRAYEEAMSRLRLRDDERLAAFDREKSVLTAVLRDRETMARAGELTAGIVHEVRNSLGTIVAQAKIAEKASDDRLRPPVLAIMAEVHTLESMMNRFLDFIRTEKVQDDEFDLAKLVGRVVLRERASHPARVEIEGSETIARGDEDLLERAIENLVRNACQASGPGGKVVVRFGADETQAFVIVEDTGPGVVDVQRALRPFESSRAGGLGLGLPLALKILALHQGSIDLGPNPEGRGTQAVCRWPKERSDATIRNAGEPAASTARVG